MALFHCFYGWRAFHCIYIVYHILIHSSVDGHLGCFRILAIVKLLWTLGCVYPFELVSLVFSDIDPGVELPTLNHCALRSPWKHHEDWGFFCFIALTLALSAKNLKCLNAGPVPRRSILPPCWAGWWSHCSKLWASGIVSQVTHLGEWTASGKSQA